MGGEEGKGSIGQGTGKECCECGCGCQGEPGAGGAVSWFEERENGTMWENLVSQNSKCVKFEGRGKVAGLEHW